MDEFTYCGFARRAGPGIRGVNVQTLGASQLLFPNRERTRRTSPRRCQGDWPATHIQTIQGVRARGRRRKYSLNSDEQFIKVRGRMRRTTLPHRRQEDWPATHVQTIQGVRAHDRKRRDSLNSNKQFINVRGRMRTTLPRRRREGWLATHTHDPSSCAGKARD